MLGVDIEFRLQFYTCLACLLIICTCILQVSKCLYWFIMVYKEVAIWGGGGGTLIISYIHWFKEMAYYGIQSTTLYWVMYFLHGRNQQVVIDGETSSPAVVTSGVPQGTALSPT